MITLPIWAWKLIAGLALVAGACVTTWFIADAHYTKQYTALKASYEQANKDQAAEDATTLTRYAAASLQVNDEAQKQIAGMSVDIADLSMRHSGSVTALQLCTADSVREPVPVAVGPGTAASPGSDASPVGSSEPTVAVPLTEYRDTLSIGIKAIDAELAMRRIFREGGQAPQ